MAKKKQNKILIEGQWFRVSDKTGRASKVPLTHCNNTMTTAEFKGWVLSGLRDRTRYWAPANAAWKLYTRPNQSGSRHKIEHQCNVCKGWFVKKKVKNRNTIELDHIIPCGGLNDFSKAGEWVAKAFVEIDGYQKLCISCHSIKTKDEKCLKTK